MQVAITCRHGQISDAVREHISRKSEKLLTYFERVTAIEVTVDFEKDRIQVEILVHTERRQNLVSHDVGDEVQPTFDGALRKMEHQIKKYKQKIQDHRRSRRSTDVSQSETESE